MSCGVAATVCPMDIASGVFALAGVTVAAVFSELRAWRETRTARGEALLQLRRETYARALRQLETLASKSAQWVEAPEAVSREPASKLPVWEAMTVVYETMNEVRLAAVDLGRPKRL